jgi:drug/metabolite transporter (DMT)-like permease
MWLFFALISGLFYTVQGLITRHILRGNKDAWAFSFYFSAIGAIVSLPFMLMNLKVATHFTGWALMILVGFLIVLQNFLNFKSANTLEASVGGSITKFRLVWVFLLGIIVLHEQSSWLKLIGTLTTVLAGVIILNKFRKPSSLTGVAFAFTATIVYGIIILLYKYLFSSFNTAGLTFFIFFIPAVLNLLIMPHALSRIKMMLREQRVPVILACGFGGFANLAMNQSLAIGEVSKALVIIEAFLVITLIGEHIFLKEKSQLLTKAVAVGLATVGAILIRLA